MTKSRIQYILNRNLVYLGFMLASFAGEISWLFSKAEKIFATNPLMILIVILTFMITVVFLGVLTLNSIRYEKMLDNLTGEK